MGLIRYLIAFLLVPALCFGAGIGSLGFGTSFQGITNLAVDPTTLFAPLWVDLLDDGPLGQTPTYTRASTAVATQWDGTKVEVASGEARFDGLRRVSEGNWVDNDGTTALVHPQCTMQLGGQTYQVPCDIQTWAADTVYAAGAIVVAATGTNPSGGAGNGYWFKTTAGGTSDAAEPAWDTTIGNTTADNTVTWTNMGLYRGRGYHGEQASTNRVEYSRVQADSTGAELITDGTFDTDCGGGNWTCADAAITIGVSGTASWDGTQAGNANLYQTGVTTYGAIFEVTYTVSGYSAGQVRTVLGGNSQGTYRTANGTYTETLSNGTTNLFAYIQGDADFIGNVDNFSVKRVSWATGEKSFYLAGSWRDAVTGVAMGGDTAGVTTITDCSASLDAGTEKLSAMHNADKCYVTTCAGGAGDCIVTLDGTTGSTSATSSCVWAFGDGTIYLSGESATETTISGATFDRFCQQGATPDSTGEQLTLAVAPDDTLTWTLPTMEVAAFASSTIISNGTATSRSADSLSYPASIINNAAGVAFLRSELDGDTGTDQDILRADTTNFLFGDITGGTKFKAYDDTNTVNGPLDADTALYGHATAWSGSALQVCGNGSCGTAGSFDGSWDSAVVEVMPANGFAHSLIFRKKDPSDETTATAKHSNISQVVDY